MRPGTPSPGIPPGAASTQPQVHQAACPCSAISHPGSCLPEDSPNRPSCTGLQPLHLAPSESVSWAPLLSRADSLSFSFQPLPSASARLRNAGLRELPFNQEAPPRACAPPSPLPEPSPPALLQPGSQKNSVRSSPFPFSPRLKAICLLLSRVTETTQLEQPVTPAQKTQCACDLFLSPRPL